MPKFTLPKPKPQKKINSPMVGVASDDWSWRRKITIPINAAIANGLEVGDDTVIELRGTVVGLSMNKSESSDHCSLEIDLEAVMSEQGPEDMKQSDYEEYRRTGKRRT